MQLRSVAGYYPYHNRIMDNIEKLSNLHHKIMVITDPLHTEVYPLGRGKNITTNPKNYKHLTLCFKIFLNGKQFQYFTLNEFLKQHQSIGTFCTPLIDLSGVIYAGETKYCKVLGHITDPEEVIVNNIKKFIPCGVCGVEITKEKVMKKLKIPIVTTNNLFNNKKEQIVDNLLKSLKQLQK